MRLFSCDHIFFSQFPLFVCVVNTAMLSSRRRQLVSSSANLSAKWKTGETLLSLAIVVAWSGLFWCYLFILQASALSGKKRKHELEKGQWDSLGIVFFVSFSFLFFLGGGGHFPFCQFYYHYVLRLRFCLSCYLSSQRGELSQFLAQMISVEIWVSSTSLLDCDSVCFLSVLYIIINYIQ